MAIVGFGFNLMEVERKKPISGKVTIKNNIAIKNVEQYNPELAKKSNTDGLRFEFEFISNYEPSMGRIRLVGEVFYLGDKKTVQQTLKTWKKEKKVAKELLPVILNYALNRAHVQAISLSKDAALPPPIQMPRIKMGNENKNYIG